MTRSPSEQSTGCPTSGNARDESGAKLKPDLVWLRRDAGDKWRKVVVDVKITSTDKMNESFREKDEKY